MDIKFPNDQLQKFSGRGLKGMELLPSGDKKEATYKKEKINEKCHNYLLILEIKWQERVSSFISGKKSAIDSEIPCWTNEEPQRPLDQQRNLHCHASGENETKSVIHISKFNTPT